METTHVIQVDGKSYFVCFQGFDEPMKVQTTGGELFTFSPWRYKAHMEALGLSLEFGEEGLALDVGLFCQCVARRVVRPVGDDANLEGLILWWASGGNVNIPVQIVQNSWLNLGSTRVQLEGWSNGDRVHALSLCVVKDGEYEYLDVVGYLDRMIRASVKEIRHETELDDLDSGAATALIQAVIRLNLPESSLPEDIYNGNPEAARIHAQTTLRLCAALGWLPSQVWKTPAVEVDRLLAILDRVQPLQPPSPATSSRLADHPDAVVIHFGDD